MKNDVPSHLAKSYLTLVPSLIATAVLTLTGCKTQDSCCTPGAAPTSTPPKTTSQAAPASPKVLTDPATGTTFFVGAVAVTDKETGETKNLTPTAVSVARAKKDTKDLTQAKRFNYTPKPYPVDERGFSPVDKSLAKYYAREEMVKDDEEGSLNPYVMTVIAGFPLDGSLPYHCSWEPREYDIYNGVTQDMWYKGMVVAKAYPDGSRCSYCCGFTFEVFLRAMRLRNIQKGIDPDDFNGMTFGDLFNALQFWYIEGKGDCERRAIESYGLGYGISVDDLEKVKPGDFLSYDTTAPGGHSCIFVEWQRDEQNKIVGIKYFSSNLSGSKGVGYGQGKFSDTNGGKGIIRKSLRLARVGAIKDYKPFNRADIPQRNAYAPTQPNRVIYVPAPAAPAATAAPAVSVK